MASGCLATPPGGSGPGVLVIQEWWGLDSETRQVTDRLADEGFVAMARICITASWPRTMRWTRPRI